MEPNDVAAEFKTLTDGLLGDPDIDLTGIDLTGIDMTEVARVPEGQVHVEPSGEPSPTLVPILTGQQAQGDVLVVPLPAGSVQMPFYVQPKRHHVVVPLIAEGNGHQLRVDLSRGGQVFYAPLRQSPIDLGVLQVSGGAVVYVEQLGGVDPHGRLGIGAGENGMPRLYRLRRQRMVAHPQSYWVGWLASRTRRRSRRWGR
jgi:hypothetical protein